MPLRSPLLRMLVASALLFSAGCHMHAMQNLPGRLGSRLIVDNGVSVLDGRVLYLNPDRADKTTPLEVPFAGATLDVLGPDGKALGEFPPVRSDAKGRFHFDGLTVGQPYFVRARLTDPTGAPRQLFAFVLPESRYTCVELSLASTIVAQKIAASPDQLALVKPGLVKEMIQTVRETLSAEYPGPVAPGGGPTTTPPAGAFPGPAVQPPVGEAPGGVADPDAPTGTIWVPGPNGGGYWWCPGAGGEGGAWWITTPCGGFWWAPKLGGAGGAWWVIGADGRGAWQRVPAGSRLSVPGGSCSFTVTPPPAENCGCVCVPALDGSGVYWFLPNATMTGGSWWFVSRLGGTGAWQPATSASDPTTGWQPAVGASSAPGGATVAAPYDTVTWITLPGGGGGHYWSPGGGPGGSWWIPTGNGGGYWWTSSGAGGGTPPHNCGCVWVQLPGSTTGYWFSPNGSGTGGSFYIIDQTTGGGTWWTPGASSGSGSRPTAAAPTSGGSGGAWTSVPGGGTDYIWIVVPGGGGYWWAPPRYLGGSGHWWVPNGTGSGGTWWVSTGAGAGAPPPGPQGGLCGCHWVQIPGSSVGYWYLPGPNGAPGSWYVHHTVTGGGAWVSATDPAIARGGPAPTPTPVAGGGTAVTPAPTGGARTTVVRWLELPGGGLWWYPWPGGGGSYWDGVCGCWVAAPANQAGYYWIVRPGGGGTWLWPSPDGLGCCVWVPDGQGGGRWVWISYGPGAGAPPAAPTTIGYGDLAGLIDALTSPTWTPGETTTAGAFDRISAGVPALKTQLEQAIDTILNVNIRINYFQGVNAAPFPRKDDPKYLLIGTVELRCALDGLPAGLPGVAYALNGKEICRTTSAGDAWNAEYDTHQTPDGEYFLTAHEAVPGQGLGKLLAKGYARIRNAGVSEDPCAEDPISRPTPQPSRAPDASQACSGPFLAFTQGGWGSAPAGANPGAFLKANFGALTGGTLTIGVGRTLSFTSAAAVEAFLPAGGPPASLESSATNPTTSAAGVFAGQLVAAKLNVLKSDAGLNPAATDGRLRAVKFGTGDFAGRPIGEVIALAERVIGGEVSALPAGATISELSDALASVNEGFPDPGGAPDGMKFRCP